MTFGPKYYWIHGAGWQGKETLVGPYVEKPQAASRGKQLCDSKVMRSSEVFALSTRDARRAREEVAAILSERGG